MSGPHRSTVQHGTQVDQPRQPVHLTNLSSNDKKHIASALEKKKQGLPLTERESAALARKERIDRERSLRDVLANIPVEIWDEILERHTPQMSAYKRLQTTKQSGIPINSSRSRTDKNFSLFELFDWLVPKLLEGFRSSAQERMNAGLPERSNLPVQGTAADIIKKALALLVDRIDTETKIVAIVHDEILIECPNSQTEQAAAILKSSMEDAVNSILPNVPTIVEPVISSSWAEK